MATPFDTLEITEEEKQALLELKVLIQDVIKEGQRFDNDNYLLTWLRGWKLNVSKAEKMIRQSIVYFEVTGLNYIDKWQNPEVIEKYLPIGNFGEDREGRPVQYNRFGRLDMRGMSQSVSKVDMLRNMHKTGLDLEERKLELSRKLGREIDKMTLVVDLEGLGLQHFHTRALSYFKSLVRASEDNYPEKMALILVITNSPVFHIAWEFASRIIDEETKKKMKFIRKSECEGKLRRYISPEQLPQCYGGTACVPDTFCTDALGMGGIIPERYYLKNILENERQLELTIVPVQARSSAQILIEVKEPRSVLCWVFKTENYDINFGIYFQPLDKVVACHITELKCVWAPQRCDSHIVPDKGDIMCITPGTYVLYWDNSYSWFHNKEIQYICNIVEPNTPF